jgi:hypothetical protein
MYRIRVVLKGDHGGELDSETITLQDGVHEEERIKETLAAVIDRCTLNVGDTITIENVN